MKREWRENDLVLRDMGHFSLAEFVEIELRGAWWLTRVPLTLGLRDDSGKSLERILQSRCGNIIDLPVQAGEAGHECRLVAIRASGIVARKRGKQRRKEAMVKGVEPDAAGLIRDGWHLMLTNLPVADFPPNLLWAIYRARGVEIQFGAWKRANNLDKALSRRSGKHHPAAILLSAMINHLVGMRMARVLGEKKAVDHLSYEKLYGAPAIDHEATKRWEELLTFTPFMKQAARDKRGRKPQ